MAGADCQHVSHAPGRGSPGADPLVAAGNGFYRAQVGLDEHAVRDTAARGTAWTPTVGALLACATPRGVTPQRRCRFQEGRAWIAGLPTLAAQLGVPVPAGTDVTGSIPQEVALLAQMGLELEPSAGRGQHQAAAVPRRPSRR